MTTIDRRYGVAEGTAVKAPCRAATTANITLGGLQTIDGIALAESDRVLVKNQSTGLQNGIYSASTGNWTRTKDFDGAYDIVTGTRVYITAGTVSARFEYAVSTADPITIDTTSIAFVSLGQASADAAATATAAAAAAAASAATATAAAAAAAASVSASAIPVPTGRLTLTSGVAVMGTTVSAATTIYYTPAAPGNTLPIYGGSVFVATTFAELSCTASDTTKNPSAIGTNKVNDWFVWNDAGTMRLSHGPDWTDDNTRSAGAALTTVLGIPLNAVSITNGPAASRGTWVGTTRSATGTFEYSFGTLAIGAANTALLMVWNAYNRVEVGTVCRDTTDSWTVPGAGSPVWRNANVNAQGRIYFVQGSLGDHVYAAYNALGSSASGSHAVVGVGVNSLTAFSGSTGFINSTETINKMVHAEFNGPTNLLGLNYVCPIEYNAGPTNAVTFFGDAGLPLFLQTGFHARFWA